MAEQKSSIRLAPSPAVMPPEAYRPPRHQKRAGDRLEIRAGEAIKASFPPAATTYAPSIYCARQRLIAAHPEVYRQAEEIVLAHEADKEEKKRRPLEVLTPEVEAVFTGLVHADDDLHQQFLFYRKEAAQRLGG